MCGYGTSHLLCRTMQPIERYCKGYDVAAPGYFVAILLGLEIVLIWCYVVA